MSPGHLVRHLKESSLVMPKEKLFRAKRSSKFKTILVVGSGAIKDSWTPLPGALGCPHIQDPNILAAILAAFTYHYRRLRNELLISVHNQAKDPVAQVENLSMELHTLYEHRHQVANAYQTAQLMKKIGLRACEPIDDLLQKNADEVGVITTNWDGILWNDERIQNIIQLHGLVSNPDSLILPSELGTDDHIFELAINKALAESSEELKLATAKLAGHFRGKGALLLRDAHELAVKWLSTAEEVFVWGLALHPYDAELITVLQSIQGPNSSRALKQVTILNPNESDRNRVGVFLGSPPINRRDFDPQKNQWL